MDTFVILFLVVPSILLLCCGLSTGDECRNVPGRIQGVRTINMCASGTHTVKAMYISASRAEMGEGTRCNCTMVALSERADSTFLLAALPRESNCTATFSVRGSTQAAYSCHTTDKGPLVGMDASQVKIELLGSGSTDFGFCLAMVQDQHQFNLTCENDAATKNTTSVATTDSSSSPTVSSVFQTSASSAPVSAISTDVSSSSSTAAGETLSSSALTSFLTMTATSPSDSDATTATDETEPGPSTTASDVPTVPRGSSTTFSGSSPTPSSTTAPVETAVTWSSQGVAVSTGMRSTSPPQSSSSTISDLDPNHSFPLALTAGVAAGAFVLVLIITSIVVWRFRSRKHAGDTPSVPGRKASRLSSGSDDLLQDNFVYKSSMSGEGGALPYESTAPVNSFGAAGSTPGDVRLRENARQVTDPSGKLLSPMEKNLDLPQGLGDSMSLPDGDVSRTIYHSYPVLGSSYADLAEDTEIATDTGGEVQGGAEHTLIDLGATAFSTYL